MNDTAAEPPAGFVPFPAFEPPGFNAHCGPIWIKPEGGKLVGGFRVEQRHCNPSGMCHGGMIATFCDMHMGVAAQYERQLNTDMLATITLSVDYLAPSPKGAWIEARAEIMKVTRGTVFTNETILADGKPTAHARGIYKLRPLADDEASSRSLSVQLRASLHAAVRP